MDDDATPAGRAIIEAQRGLLLLEEAIKAALKPAFLFVFEVERFSQPRKELVRIGLENI